MNCHVTNIWHSAGGGQRACISLLSGGRVNKCVPKAFKPARIRGVVGLLQKLPLSWALGLSLFSARRRSRVSVTTVVSVFGIGVGVATLTAVLAVTGGFEDAFREKMLGVLPHLVVIERSGSFYDYQTVGQVLETIDGVAQANPSTYDEMMVSSDAGSSGAIVKGMDLDGLGAVMSIRSLVKAGSIDDLQTNEEHTGVAVGCNLMERLEVSVGDYVTLTTPLRNMLGGNGGLGMQPLQGRFVVKACFISGFYEYDSRLIVMDLASAQNFLGRGDVVRWIELRATDLFSTDTVRQKAHMTMAGYTMFDFVRDAKAVGDAIGRVAELNLESVQARPLADMVATASLVHRALEYSDVGMGPDRRFRMIDWKEMNQNLFSALATQKVVLALFFLIIVVVAAFNIVGTQLIVARERIKEISTLVALGASRGQLMKVFVVHGFTLGSIGVAVGVLLGWGVVHLIRMIDFDLDPEVYLISELPAVLHWPDVATIAGLSALVVLISCVLSAWRATRLNPVDGLRKVT